MQPTAFGAQDRCFFEISLCDAPRRRLMGRPLGAVHQRLSHDKLMCQARGNRQSNRFCSYE